MGLLLAKYVFWKCENDCSECTNDCSKCGNEGSECENDCSKCENDCPKTLPLQGYTKHPSAWVTEYHIDSTNKDYIKNNSVVVDATNIGNCRTIVRDNHPESLWFAYDDNTSTCYADKNTALLTNLPWNTIWRGESGLCFDNK